MHCTQPLNPIPRCDGQMCASIDSQSSQSESVLVNCVLFHGWQFPSGEHVIRYRGIASTDAASWFSRKSTSSAYSEIRCATVYTIPGVFVRSTSGWESPSPNPPAGLTFAKYVAPAASPVTVASKLIRSGATALPGRATTSTSAHVYSESARSHAPVASASSNEAARAMPTSKRPAASVLPASTSKASPNELSASSPTRRTSEMAGRADVLHLTGADGARHPGAHAMVGSVSGCDRKDR
mmetsp:Transcript_15553/g.40338  ORF Transcript_15553/g.40338 Transcript_15553/m.40338 type:complete len:239 (-) Transcript_15553:296-1012(-)